MDSILRLLSLILCIGTVFSAELPQNVSLGKPSEDDIHFYLFTRHNGADHPQEIHLSAMSLIAHRYNPSLPTIVLSHGFQSEGIKFTRPYAEAYFQVGDFNVIAVDWGKLALWNDYPGAVVRTRFVGDYAAKLLQLLAENGGVQNVQLIGHSLGAHVVGFMGKRFQEMGYGKIPRITGLDPAEPGFDLAFPSRRLDKEDAEFVDVIHTNSGMIWEGCLSITKPIGHMDFYPGGGKHQPGCKDICIGEDCTHNNINDLIKGGCSHHRANLYYYESILASKSREHNKFKSFFCRSWDFFNVGECCLHENVYMGHSAKKGVEGRYMLIVGEESPFAVVPDGYICPRDQ